MLLLKFQDLILKKFPTSNGILGVQMQSVGEVMAIGRTFRESLQKAFRSLEVGLIGFQAKKTEYRSLDLSKIRFATSFRLIKVKQALEEGYSIEEIYDQTKIDFWFLYQIQKIIQLEKELENENLESLIQLKRNGFSDKQIGKCWNKTEIEIRKQRIKNKIIPTYKVVDTCAAEFIAETPIVIQHMKLKMKFNHYLVRK